MANLTDIAVSLFEALQDGKKCAVEIQPIREVAKDSKKYYLRIDGKRHSVSEKIATNAIAWKVPVVQLDRQYRLGNLRFTV